jgi:hypothetical protein
MRNDDHLIFENYFKKLGEAKASPSHFSGLPVKPVGSFANAPIPKGYDAIQNMINRKLSAKDKKKSEDEESHCKYAGEGCDCNECQECKDNQTKSEDNETTGDDIMNRIEQKRKERKNIGSVRSKSEDSEWDDEERHGDANGRWSDKHTGASHRDDQGDDEDAETLSVEEKIKMALHEVEGFGYTGDHLDCKEMAKLVVGSPGDWGDSYGHVVQALEHVLSAYYEKGLQDS